MPERLCESIIHREPDNESVINTTDAPLFMGFLDSDGHPNDYGSRLIGYIDKAANIGFRFDVEK